MVKTIFKWLGIGVAAVMALSVATLMFKLLMAPLNTAHTVANTAGQVVSKTLDADNVITTYEWFHDAHGQYMARVSQITQTAAFYNGEQDAGERTRLRVDLGAQQQSCRDLVARYNANATKSNRSIFQGSALPEKLDPASCEATLN